MRGPLWLAIVLLAVGGEAGAGVEPLPRAFGLEDASLPAAAWLVRSGRPLPAVDGLAVLGRRGDTFLVTGDAAVASALTGSGCLVKAAAAATPRPWAPARTWRWLEQPDPAIQALVDEVSWTNIQARIMKLTRFRTRSAGTIYNEAAAETLRAFFQRLGLLSEFHSFTHYGRTYRNVVATQLGNAHPESIIVAVAHFDCLSEDPYYNAPGADDNASGVAAIQVAAAILARVECDYTVKYLCTNCEEIGLVGSQAWAQWARDNNLAIAGVLSYDMLGWWQDGVPFDLEVETNEESLWLASAVMNAAALYTDMPCDLHIDNLAWWGECASFWDVGYAGVNHEEAFDWGDPDMNPRYHTSGDQLRYLHPDFTTGNTKVAVAALATLARPSRPVAVSLAGFTAARAGGGAEISWRVSDPERGQAYRLWRQAGASPRELVSANVFSGRDAYSVHDADAPRQAVDYWLEEMAVDGSRAWHGPAPLPAVDVSWPALALQSRPNPFNPRTEVRYSLPVAGDLQLRVYDLRGRLVRRLVDALQPAGEAGVVWDGLDDAGQAAPAGVYVLRLAAAGRAASATVTLAR